MMKIFAPKTLALAATLMTLASGLAHADTTQPSVAYPENAGSHLNRTGTVCDGCGLPPLRFTSDEGLFGGSSLDGVR